MRVVIADDSVLLREGIAACSRTRVSTWSDKPRRRSAAPEGALVRRTSRSSTSACRPRIPTRACRRRRRSASPIEALPACSMLSQYVEPGYAMELLQEARRALVICSRTGSRMSASSQPRSSQVGRAAQRSIPRWSRSSSAGIGRTIVSDLTPREREVLGSWQRALQPGHCRASRRDRARSREARDKHLREAPPSCRARGSPARARRARLPEVVELVSGRRVVPHAARRATLRF